jgi:acetyl-CoA carboxylase biotin carboxyl carrier protein
VDLKEIKAIIDLMKENDLSVFEMEKEGFKLKLQKGVNGTLLTVPPAIVSAPASAVSGQAASQDAGAAASEQAGTTGALKEIASPMVGTFYRGPSPEAPAFVDVGATVNEDTVVCIIEAMKVMNEIKAETSGVIAEIMVENGKPVQFGQVLFRVR